MHLQKAREQAFRSRVAVNFGISDKKLVTGFILTPSDCCVRPGFKVVGAQVGEANRRFWDWLVALIFVVHFWAINIQW